LICLTALGLPGAVAADGAGEDAAEPAAHILTLEKHRREAMVARDVATLELLFAADATYSHSTGRVQTRDDLLGVLADGSVDYRSIMVSSEVVRVYGTVAVVTGEQWIDVTADLRHIKSQSCFTTVYTVIDGDWKLVAYQSTPVRSRQLKSKTNQ
jgi:hypothetical protein